MVFSEKLARERPRSGHATVVPCRNRVESPGSLVEEAKALWTAERNVERSNGRICADWGSLALAASPSSELRARGITEKWAEHVSRESGYGAIPRAADEQAIVSDDGKLLLPWPQSTDGAPVDLDLILATVTSPSLLSGKYASPDAIAGAWVKHPNRAEYFWNNRKHGIETFQDGEIEALLHSASEPTRP